MKQKAKLRPIERVQPEVLVTKPVKVRAHRHGTMCDSIREAPVLIAQVRAKIAQDKATEESRIRLFNARNQVSWKPDQVRAVLGKRGSLNMNTPTREDYRKKRGQVGKSGMPLSLDKLRSEELNRK